MAAVLQWNCRGYRSNYADLVCLIRDHSPKCIAIQETQLGNHTPRPPQGYDIVCFSPTVDPAPGNGLAILLHNSIPHINHPINTTLQALACRVGLRKTYTICNLYVSPNTNLTYQELHNLITQLPPPFIILGDLNSKHTIWGNNTIDQRGRAVEQLLINTDVSLLNTGAATHFHVQTGTTSAIDISMCSPDVVSDLSWRVLDDLYGSDHYPIIVQEINAEPVAREPKFIFKRANWKLFTQETATDNTNEDFSCQDNLEIFNTLIINAAINNIPMSSGKSTRIRVPWWTDDCTRVNRERKRALRRYQQTGLIADKITYNRMRAIAQFTKNNARSNSWKQYISSLNSTTPMTKIWARIRKMSGKYKQYQSPCIMHNNTLVTEEGEVANILAQHYESVSSHNSYSAEFLQIKRNQEADQLDFSSREEYDYNSPITIKEIKGVLQQCKNTAPGEDGVVYQMLKRIHLTALSLLQKIFNQVWLRNQYPTEWRKAIVLSFLKPNKPATESASYRPIALSSCTGKLLEKIVNIRLMNHIEREALLSPLQYGFRKMRSSVDALIRVTSDIHEAFARKEHLVCVFFDMQKAYDTTWHTENDS